MFEIRSEFVSIIGNTNLFNFAIDREPAVPKNFFSLIKFILTLNLKMITMITKISNNEKVSDTELNEIKELQKQFETHIDGRSLSNKEDKRFFVSSEKL